MHNYPARVPVGLRTVALHDDFPGMERVPASAIRYEMPGAEDRVVALRHVEPIPPAN